MAFQQQTERSICAQQFVQQFFYHFMIDFSFESFEKKTLFTTK